ncbi:phosphonate ABC transporter ATP-binding protein [Leptolyngbya sp. CCNP1308]|uniref:phosphonate ABC transporter ATP-binding protein n=1 Tax=Leptolyngbya sp. CCNP1308 TaxID=3110255 RepID=UPI002B20F4B8|nr:phosphonate ABC transporter ATP-binding protein [Leptolyngbya sp. CCNP1308]MEA5452842.1 phosphonate ABC transporter ATP-binding protein [Leptolyngbya sp. CCNP1308]
MLSLQVNQLTKVYSNHTLALNQISFKAKPGESVVILGANGSGKSTLLRCLVGLEKPTSGQVFLGNWEVTALPNARLRTVRRRVGMVFQHFNLVKNLSAFHNVLQGALGRSRGPWYWFPATAPAVERQRAMDCLAQVHLADLATQRVDTLSGGQQQRVAIARMLMQNPDIVLVDEPVASLDPKAGREVMDLLYTIVREQGLTMICNLHQLDLAMTYADRIIGLSSGQIVLDQPVTNVNSDALDWLYQRSAPKVQSEVIARR